MLIQFLPIQSMALAYCLLFLKAAAGMRKFAAGNLQTLKQLGVGRRQNIWSDVIIPASIKATLAQKSISSPTPPNQRNTNSRSQAKLQSRYGWRPYYNAAPLITSFNPL